MHTNNCQKHESENKPSCRVNMPLAQIYLNRKEKMKKVLNKFT